MTAATKKDYQERINRVMTYIEEHLGEELDLLTLAEVSYFSPYHFHRILKAHLGESLGTYVTRLRMERAGRNLRFTDDPVNDIGFQVGYSHPAAFSTAFRKHFGCSPSEFRNNVNLHFMSDSSNQPAIQFSLKPKIKEVKPVKVIFIQVIGSYGDPAVGEAWQRLLKFVKEKRLFSFGMASLGLSHDDPNITDEEKCRYDACFTVKKDVKPEGEIGVKSLDGGRYAVFNYKGPYTGLGDVYCQIFNKWLPDCNYELREAPIFEKYLNRPSVKHPEKNRTAIHIPIL